MSTYLATVIWQRNDEDFLAHKYSRAHVWQFDGGTEIAASASPHIVPLPWSREENVDPEEAYIAAISSCHMLFFLDIAAQRGLQVERYEDHATGRMGKNEEGKIALVRIALNPEIEFSSQSQPDQATIDAIHQQAHEQCFLANSVKTEIAIPGL
jgi:organic hydroperoxide reductase OsmC/OhrA